MRLKIYECLTYGPHKVHVTEACHHKFNSCWRKAKDVSEVREVLGAMKEDEDFEVEGEELIFPIATTEDSCQTS